MLPNLTLRVNRHPSLVLPLLLTGGQTMALQKARMQSLSGTSCFSCNSRMNPPCLPPIARTPLPPLCLWYPGPNPAQHYPLPNPLTEANPPTLHFLDSRSPRTPLLRHTWRRLLTPWLRDQSMTSSGLLLQVSSALASQQWRQSATRETSSTQVRPRLSRISGQGRGRCPPVWKLSKGRLSLFRLTRILACWRPQEEWWRHRAT